MKKNLLLVLLVILIGSAYLQLRQDPILYFGGFLTNSFQTKGDFYDPVKGHTGIDIGMIVGTPLSLSVPLRAVDIREQYEMGKVLYMEDAWGNVLVFAHLSEILVEVGEVVKADQVFAKSGNTGAATKGPHLHFEILSEQAELGYEIMTRTLGNYKGYNIDPITYLLPLPPAKAGIPLDF